MLLLQKVIDPSYVPLFPNLSSEILIGEIVEWELGYCVEFAFDIHIWGGFC